MKKIFSFMFLAMVMLLTSCSQDTVVEEATSAPLEGRQITLTAGISQDSRIAYDDLSGKLTWEKGDKIFVYAGNQEGDMILDEDNQPVLSVFDLVGEGGSATAQFTGKTIPGAAIYLAMAGFNPLLSGNPSFIQDSAHPTDHIVSNSMLQCMVFAADLETKGFQMDNTTVLIRFDLKSLPDFVGDIDQVQLFYNGGNDPVTLKIKPGSGQPTSLYIPILLAQKKPFYLDHFKLVFNNTYQLMGWPGKEMNPGGRYFYTVTDKGGDGDLKTWEKLTGNSITVKTVGNARPAEISGYSLSQEGDSWVYRAPKDIKDLNFNFRQNTQITEITIPSAVTDLLTNEFNGCTALTNVIFPEDSKLNIIRSSAFDGCSSLAELHVPASVQTIETAALQGCTHLTSVTFGAGSQLTTIESLAFQNTAIQSIQIPDRVESIGQEAFSDCASLQNVTLPNNPKFTTLTQDLFLGCTSLTAIQIPSSVTTLESFIFKGCNLTEITIPASVTAMANYAISGCGAKKLIYLPSDKVKVFSEQIRLVNGSNQDVDLVLDSSWKTSITDNQWAGLTWKSISFIN